MNSSLCICVSFGRQNEGETRDIGVGVGIDRYRHI